MNKKSLYYYLGVLLLGLGSVSYFILAIYWLVIALVATGITFIALSDSKTWLKITTIILIPILTVVFLLIVFIALVGDKAF